MADRKWGKPAPRSADEFVAAGDPMPTAMVETAAPAKPARATKAAPAPKGPMKRLTIDIDAAMHRKLKMYCVERELDIAELLRELIAKRIGA